MSRRWIALTSGLVVSTLFVTMALGQASKPPASLADRMSALRRGWSQGQTQSQRERRCEFWRHGASVQWPIAIGIAFHVAEHLRPAKRTTRGASEWKCNTQSRSRANEFGTANQPAKPENG